MQTVSISTAKSKLNELVDEAVTTREHVTITKNGAPAAVMVSVEEWDSIQETLFWQSQPNLTADIAEAQREYAAGETVGAEEMRRRYGLPPR